MEWYVKLGLLVFTSLISIPYIVQKFMPPKADKKGYQSDDETIYDHHPFPDIYEEPQHSDVTIMRKRQRKKQEQSKNHT